MFLETNSFPFVRALEAESAAIRGEFQQLPAGQLAQWPQTKIYEGNWSVFGLYAFGEKVVGNCKLCPRTTRAVEAIPGVTTAGFSVLSPSTEVRPHVGITTTVLRCHLGLIAPGNCGLKVGEVIQSWEEGKCLIFDDTIRHSAWNHSQRDRVVLLIDFLKAGCAFARTSSINVLAERLRPANQ